MSITGTTIDVTIVSPLGTHQTSLPTDLPLRSFLGDLLVSIGLNPGLGSEESWYLAGGDGRVLPLGGSLAAALVSTGETLRLIPRTPAAVDDSLLVVARGAPGSPSARPPEVAGGGLEVVPSPVPATTAAQLPDQLSPEAGSLLERTRRTIPAPVPWFRRMAGWVKAGTGTPSPAAVELLGRRGPDDREPETTSLPTSSPRPADLTVAHPPSALERARAEWRVTDYRERLDVAILRPRLRRCVTVAVVSPKGGVGKTTVTALLGMLLSHIRRDRIVAIDTNPDYGSLGRVLTPDQQLFVDDLLARMALPDLTLTELDSQLGRAAHGLMVLPAPTDPGRMARLDEPGYRTVISRLKDYVGVIILDCGTGLQDPASQAAIATCDQIVLITDAEPATASLVAEAGSLLMASGRPITVVVNKLPKKSRLDLDRLGRYVPGAAAMLTIPASADGAGLLASGGFDWRDAPAAWTVAVRELAVALVAAWERLGLTVGGGPNDGNDG